MRNLKRALSLTLASVMLLGMMVVGSSAAAGYDDVAETDNVEAIEVLQAIEVMVGDERGFGPERPVNRAEMAVVMGKLLSLDYNYYEATCPFNDVYDWARGWVGACYANGIVSGRGEGVYDPGTTVTAVEAASMLMRALGYFKYQSDYTNGFEVATVSQATKIRLFDGVDSKTNEPLTRNQVAQMVLNALKSGVVEPDGNALNFVDTNGNVIATGGKVNYVFVTSNKSYATAISSIDASSMGSYNDAPIVELGEQLYNGNLKLNDTTDAFGRPARQWEYDAKEIGTYVKVELLKEEYSVEVTGKMLFNLLTKPTIDKYDFSIAIDGIECVEANRDILGEAYFTKVNLINTNTKGVGKTGKGVLTQVFVDPDKNEQMVYIAVINTYLAKAIDDYKTNKEEVDFTVWSVEDKNPRSDMILVKNDEKSVSLTVKNEDINVENVKEDDIVLVHVAEGEIKEIFDPEVVDNTEISAFKRDSWVNANGTQYDYADTIQYDTEVLDEYDDKNMKDTTYRVFLDQYGYAIGVEIIDDAEDYVFLTGIDLNTSNLYNKTADGNVIHLDGTMETVRINMDDSRNAHNEKFNANTGNTRVNSLMNTWCTYSVDSKGVYTLTEVANDEDSFTSKFVGNSTERYSKDEKRQNDKLGQGHNDNAVTLDKAHAGLVGIRDDVSGFKTVHANDDSVFLAVKTELITATDVLSTKDNKYPAIIINDVDSVETGIQNVNLKAYTAQGVVDSETKYKNSGVNVKNDVSHGVYTLFKDNGYVVAAVVVGEDDGTATNYAYIVGTVKQEAYDKTKDEYTWSINAIVNGEQVTLEEKGSNSKYLTDMAKGQWWEVKYKTDGTVRKAEYISPESATQGSHSNGAYIFCENPSHVSNGYPKFIGLMEMKEDSYDAGNKTIVLYRDLMDEEDGYIISAKGRTLQIDTKRDYQHRDITVTANAKVVLVQDTQKVDNLGRPVGKVSIMDRVEDCGEGQNGLKKAVDWLENNKTFYGYVGAIIEDGVATSIIIWDETAYKINVGGGTVTPTGKARLVWNDKDKDDQYWNLIIPAASYSSKLTTDEIKAWLVEAGCSDISKTRNGWNFTKNGTDYTDQAIVVIPDSTVTYVTVDVKGDHVVPESKTVVSGSDVTVSIKPVSGYELVSIDGVAVAESEKAGCTRTYKNVTASKTVNVVAEEIKTPGVDTYTASKDEADENFAAGATFKMYNDATGAEIALTDKIAAGTVIRFEPNAVLSATATSGKVEKGTSNGKTVWTVNGNFKVSSDTAKYVWLTKAGTLGLFETGWYDLELNPVELAAAGSMFNPVAKRFSVARDAGDPVDAGNFSSMVNGGEAAVEAVVPYKTGSMAWTFYKVDGKLKADGKPTGILPTELSSAIRYTLNHLNTFTSLTEREIPGSAGLPTAKMYGNSITIPWYNASASVKAPTAADIAKMAAKVESELKIKLTMPASWSGKVTVMNGVAADGKAYDYQVTAERQWKVTFGETEVYLPEGAGEKTVDATLNGTYIPSTNKIGSTPTTVASGKVTMTLSTDVALVPAVEVAVTGAVTGTVNGTTVNASDKYVAVGEKVTLTGTWNATRDVAILMVNDTDTATKAEKASASNFTVDYTVAAADVQNGKITLSVRQSNNVNVEPVDGAITGVLDANDRLIIDKATYDKYEGVKLISMAMNGIAREDKLDSWAEVDYIMINKVPTYVVDLAGKREILGSAVTGDTITLYPAVTVVLDTRTTAQTELKGSYQFGDEAPVAMNMSRGDKYLYAVGGTVMVEDNSAGAFTVTGLSQAALGTVGTIDSYVAYAFGENADVSPARSEKETAMNKLARATYKLTGGEADRMVTFSLIHKVQQVTLVDMTTHNATTAPTAAGSVYIGKAPFAPVVTWGGGNATERTVEVAPEEDVLLEADKDCLKKVVLTAGGGWYFKQDSLNLVDGNADLKFLNEDGVADIKEAIVSPDGQTATVWVSFHSTEVPQVDTVPVAGGYYDVGCTEVILKTTDADAKATDIAKIDEKDTLIIAKGVHMTMDSNENAIFEGEIIVEDGATLATAGTGCLDGGTVTVKKGGTLTITNAANVATTNFAVDGEIVLESGAAATIGAGATGTIAADITVAKDTTLTLNNTTAMTLTGEISGEGKVVVVGAGGGFDAASTGVIDVAEVQVTGAGAAVVNLTNRVVLDVNAAAVITGTLVSVPSMIDLGAALTIQSIVNPNDLTWGAGTTNKITINGVGAEFYLPEDRNTVDGTRALEADILVSNGTLILDCNVIVANSKGIAVGSNAARGVLDLNGYTVTGSGTLQIMKNHGSRITGFSGSNMNFYATGGVNRYALENGEIINFTGADMSFNWGTTLGVAGNESGWQAA